MFALLLSRSRCGEEFSSSGSGEKILQNDIRLARADHQLIIVNVNCIDVR